MNKKDIIGICEYLRVHGFDNSYELLDYVEDLKKQVKNEMEARNRLVDYYEYLINKALKWINENKYYFPSPNELINILKGDNK